MVDCHTKLKRTIESVHVTMKAARKLQNTALLRNLTDLSPIMHNVTHWPGKVHMLPRFTFIREELFKVRIYPEGDLPIDNSTALLSMTRRFVNMLSEIDIVTKSPQKVRAFSFTIPRWHWFYVLCSSRATETDWLKTVPMQNLPEISWKRFANSSQPLFWDRGCKSAKGNGKIPRQWREGGFIML